MQARRPGCGRYSSIRVDNEHMYVLSHPTKLHQTEFHLPVQDATSHLLDLVQTPMLKVSWLPTRVLSCGSNGLIGELRIRIFLERLRPHLHYLSVDHFALRPTAC